MKTVLLFLLLTTPALAQVGTYCEEKIDRAWQTFTERYKDELFIAVHPVTCVDGVWTSVRCRKDQEGHRVNLVTKDNLRRERCVYSLVCEGGLVSESRAPICESFL